MFNIAVLILPAAYVIAFILAFFLFWRAGRYELYESDLLFDTVGVFTFGAIIYGRIVDFLVHPEIYQWQIKRLIFFNVWGSFDFWGALLGAVILTMLFLKSQKVDFWQVFDLIAAPLIFGMCIVSAGLFLEDYFVMGQFYPLNLYFFACYFVIFWILKRLAGKMRRLGFFVSLFAVSVSLSNLLPLFIFFIKGESKFDILGIYRLVTGIGLLILGLSAWHILAKRRLFTDLKSIFAVILLGILATKRMIFSADEAGKFSKTILFFPYYLLRSFYVLLKMVIREIILGLVGFWTALKVRK